MNFLKIGLILSAFALFIVSCNQTNTTDSNANSKANETIVATNANTATAQPSATIDELASARKIYNEKCASCHKEDGTGGKVEIEGNIINAENLTTDKMKNMADAKYIRYIENGVPDEGMPAFKGELSEQEIKDIVNYIRKDFQKK